MSTATTQGCHGNAAVRRKDDIFCTVSIALALDQQQQPQAEQHLLDLQPQLKGDVEKEGVVVVALAITAAARVTQVTKQLQTRRSQQQICRRRTDNRADALAEEGATSTLTYTAVTSRTV